ncbi:MULTISPECIES: tellurite resistance TerB family protein [Deinococcus]|jgi:Tellurite resistance protein|uniref:Tellurium resistance protein TerB (TerB) putative n=1 Tax=Deinococcus radiodurans (strain ATCC 13939 / DSM 20539 / JCM 16871 / CCUG 27074 / LMG 4051 / NBRC 15346 / NCIMB 9279 / VKM B-1422 / R1) TaxID=243230 RepID=Q9RSA6_DEIRA|nr:tellurite resistance TerB family protein [Deinococcus radiodurans]AAF11761.1 tellurium resistance protein TerB (terB) putative [Deinococcus radiodurans R1 = ATCC 13939 = DSM 20539]ANC70720.1 Tellurite resistance TerB [Deinococcus radiodurans R1 = ATCC 13939 = DSM 20539]QEM71606.1 Tellurite resistance TerB [Deinococcus radiodurans]QIP27912.1 tellurite resistance TerB family protein [Deinococcus radiodurans]QIP31207.1 tellurite resistance TerB family protein [Deinococcus radiodurans]
MGFFNKLRQLAEDGTKMAQDGYARFNNAAFADATMAACALIGAADGQIDSQERSRTAQFITSSDKLRTFDVSKLREKYERYCDVISRDFDFGKIELMQVIGKVRKPEEARAVVQLAVVIANADGDFDAREQAVMREVIHALGLSPAEFGL